MILFTQISNFLYHLQNQQLTQLKTQTNDKTLKKEIDLYINRRLVCPKELLEGKHLNLPSDMQKMKKASTNTPLIFEIEDTLNITKASHDIYRRNLAVKATSLSNQLYIKIVAAKDGLSEVAAREMAEILGLGGLIPSNTIAKSDTLPDDKLRNTGLVLSRQKISQLIDMREKESPRQNIKNNLGVQNAVTKFVYNLKTSAYRTKMQNEEEFKLLHIQKLLANALDGLQFYQLLINEPIVLPGRLSESQKIIQRYTVKKVLQEISLKSFQENFLLHLYLGSQDANPGNTLFTDDPHGLVILHSIDHERIMPDDNYNITKQMPLANGANLSTITEKSIKNVFPIRLWLAGLPQANAPFTKEVIKKALDSLNPERLLAYHQQKKLFSTAAIGAQLDRILLIKQLFSEEINKSSITLTPKDLFLKLISNHPTYLFLKDELELSDLSTFMLLGQIPEGADMSLLRHPLQWFKMRALLFEAQHNEQQGRPSFSQESFKNAHAHNLLFFCLANQQKMIEGANKSGLDILRESSADLSLC